MSVITVDCRGMQCPIPVVKTIKAISELKGPAEIETLVDNETAVQNLARLAQGRGYGFASEKKGEGNFLVLIKVEDIAAAQQSAEDAADCAPDRRGSAVYAFSSDLMGTGDERLGATLMKGFIYAVSQLEELPGTCLFYNSGARLTTEGSASLDDLKSLEAQGVKILTCGTCLDFYGIKEKLAVGEVTNMYSIVDALDRASKVVKP